MHGERHRIMFGQGEIMFYIVMVLHSDILSWYCIVICCRSNVYKITWVCLNMYAAPALARMHVRESIHPHKWMLRFITFIS